MPKKCKKCGKKIVPEHWKEDICLICEQLNPKSKTCKICGEKMTEGDMFENTTGVCRICHLEERVDTLEREYKIIMRRIK